MDEAWLRQVAGQLQPALVVLGNLFRDQLDRYGELETLADEWAALGGRAMRAGPLRPQRRRPLVADLGRDEERETHRRRLFRHRRPLPGAARAAAPRTRSIAAVRARLLLRTSVRRSPRPLRRPRCGAAARSRRRCHGVELQGMRARRVDDPTPAGEIRSSCPCRASTTSTMRSPRFSRAGAGHRPARIRGGLAETRAVFGRVETRGCPRRSRSPGQEPGRDQRGAPHVAASEAGDRARPVAGAQRPHRRRPRRLLGLGRRLRAARRAVPRTSAPDPGSRRWRCGSSTPAGPSGRSGSRPEIGTR